MVIGFTVMQRFFSTLSELEFFSLSVNSLLFNQPCPHCHKCNQWCSHGYRYNQAGEIRGKRIICCARFGKRGCGKTIALYLSHVLPQRRYCLKVVVCFIQALLHGATVERAYHDAVQHNHSSHRQAYRWLNGLYAKLGLLRSQCPPAPDKRDSFIHSCSNRLTALLSTMAAFIQQWPDLSQLQIRLNQRLC